MNAAQKIVALATVLLVAACAHPDRNFSPPAANEPRPEFTAPADIAAAIAKGGYILEPDRELEIVALPESMDAMIGFAPTHPFIGL